MNVVMYTPKKILPIFFTPHLFSHNSLWHVLRYIFVEGGGWGGVIFLTKLFIPAWGWWWFGLSKKSMAVYFFAILGVVWGGPLSQACG